MRDGASWGKAFFGDFVKKIQKNFTKIGLVWVPIGQFRNFFCVGGQPTKSVIFGQRTGKSVHRGDRRIAPYIYAIDPPYWPLDEETKLS